MDFDPDTGVYEHISSGGADAFWGMYGYDGVYKWTNTFGSSVEDEEVWGINSFGPD